MKEFEEKRGDREVESVFKVLERVTELNGGEIDKVKAQCDSTLPNLNARLIAANSLCSKIIDQERSSEIVSIILILVGCDVRYVCFVSFIFFNHLNFQNIVGTSSRK